MTSNLKKTLAILISAATIAGFSGCSKSAATSSSADNSSGFSSRPTPMSNTNNTIAFGKVTAIDGSKITLALGNIARRGPSSSDGGSSASSAPKQDGGFTTTGKTETITITDTSVLKKGGMFGRGGRPGRNGSSAPSGRSSEAAGNAPSGAGQGGESASLSDIKVGTILMVATQKSSGKLISVNIMDENEQGSK